MTSAFCLLEIAMHAAGSRGKWSVKNWRSLKLHTLVAKLLPIRAASYATHLAAVTAELAKYRHIAH